MALTHDATSPGTLLWQITLPDAIDPADLDRCRSLLDADDLAATTKLLVERARAQSIIGRAAARLLLTRLTPPVRARDWRFGRGLFGKPHVVGEGPWFNLSHAGNVVVCAASTAGEVGVDTEPLDRPIDVATMSALLADEEMAGLLALPEVDRRRQFARLWTIKEAYAKANGRGISADLKKLRIAMRHSPDGTAFGTADEWFVHQFRTPTHVIAIAATTPQPPQIEACDLHELRTIVDAVLK